METVKVVDDKDLLIKKVKEYYVQVYKSHRRKKVYEGGLPRNIDFAGLKNLAIAEKMPEAIFMMMCYKEGQEKLKNVYPKEILSLFGDSEYSIKDIGANYETTLAPIKKKTGLGKEIEKYINNLLGGFEYLIDDSSSQIEKLTGTKEEIGRIIRIYQNWEVTRHTMIFGNATPYYDDTKAFDRIVNDILPIATRDIWENVYSYFKNPNNPHLPEHVILMYAKNSSMLSLGGISKSGDSLSEFSETDENGRKYRVLGLRKRGGAWRKEDRPNMFYSIYVNPLNGKCSLEKTNDFCIEVIPKRPTGELTRWTWGKEKFNAESNILIGKKVNRSGADEESWDIFRKDYIDDENGVEKTTKLKTIWVEKETNYQNAKNEIKALFGNSEVFDYDAIPISLAIDRSGLYIGIGNRQIPFEKNGMVLWVEYS